MVGLSRVGQLKGGPISIHASSLPWYVTYKFILYPSSTMTEHVLIILCSILQVQLRIPLYLISALPLFPAIQWYECTWLT